MKSMLFLAALAMVSSSIIPVMASEEEDSIIEIEEPTESHEEAEESPAHNS